MKKAIFSLFLSGLLMGSQGYSEERKETIFGLNNSFFPSALVENSVDVVSGGYYVADQDLVVSGKEPLVFRKFYSSYGSDSSYGGWDIHNSYCILPIELSRDKKGYCVIRSVTYEDEDGCQITFKIPGQIRCDVEQKDKANVRGYILEDKSHLESIPASKFTGRGSIHNLTVEYNPRDRSVEVTDGYGNFKIYKLKPNVVGGGTLKGVEKSLYRLSFERKANGNEIHYLYSNGSLPMRIESRSPGGKILYAWAEISSIPNREGKFTKVFTSSDGKRIEYVFDESIKKGFGPQSLKKASFSHLPTESYEYSKREKIEKVAINKRMLPLGRTQEVSFYDLPCYAILPSDVYLGDNPWDYSRPIMKNIFLNHRVEKLGYSVDSDGSIKTTARFIYNLSQYDDGKVLSTEVFDAYDNKVSYHFNNQQKVTKIEYFQNESGKQNLLFSESFRYDDNTKNPVLHVKTLKDNLGRTAFAKRFYYTSKGLITEERVFGNITGKSREFVELDIRGFPKEDNEYIAARYYYNAENLVEREEKPNGLTLTSTYVKGTDLLKTQFTLHKGEIKLRHFYFYDENLVLIKEVCDDGGTTSYNDLTGVTQRHIKTIKPRDGPSFAGLPDIVEERYLDLNTMQEGLVKRVQYHYNHQGKVSQEDYFDKLNQYAYSLYRKFDDRGRLIEEKDAEGIASRYQYDELNNKIQEEFDCKGSKSQTIRTIGQAIVTKIEYDKANRPIKVIKDATGDQPEIVTSKYDFKSNKVSEVDSRGNETQYKYDALNRVIEQIEPVTFDAQRRPLYSTTKYTYNVFGKVESKTNALGEVTYTKYNSLGSPIEITYHDGSKELFEYYPDGSLKQSSDRDGNITCFSYDFLGRTLSKKIKGSNGSLFSEEKWQYSSFKLTLHKDVEGKTTQYFYNGAGQLIKERECGDHLVREKEFHYDSLGRVKLTIHYNQGKDIYVYHTYNLRGDVTSKKICSKNGKLSHQDIYYDIWGNEVLATFYGKTETGTERSEYDSLGRLRQRINQRGEKYVYSYEDLYISDFNQKVLVIKEIDPSGVKTVRIHDAKGNLFRLEKRSPYQDIVLAKEDYFRDVLGREVIRIGYAYHNGKPIRTSETHWEYGLDNRILSVTEGYNTPDQVVYRFSHTPKGLVKQVSKPNGVIISYDYNPLGQKVAITSTDRSCTYYFTYTPGGQLLSAKSLQDSTSIERIVDKNGHILEESFYGAQLKISKEYDCLGRPLYLQYPDQSGVEFVFDELFLKEVARQNSRGDILYTHRFLEYDLNGNLLKECLPFGLGEVRYNYRQGSLLNIISAKTRQEVKQFDRCRRPVDVVSTYRDYSEYGWQQIEHHVEYDPLGQVCLEKSVEHTHKVKNSVGYENHYVHDSLHNRLSKNEASCEINALNQLLSQGETQFTYDLNGNLSSRKDEKGITYYEYDALDRLVKVIYPDQSVEVYGYDGLNRRLLSNAFDSYGKAVSSTFFIYDEDQEIGSWDLYKNCFTDLRVLNPQSVSEQGASISIEVDHQVLIPVKSISGDIFAIYSPGLTEKKDVTEGYHYNAFGEGFLINVVGAKKPLNSARIPWLYQAKRLDKKTGFVYFKERYYSPEIGRWISKDPAGYVDGINLYAYVRNNPVTHLDYYGLATERRNYDSPFERERESDYQYASRGSNTRSVAVGVANGAADFALNTAHDWQSLFVRIGVDTLDDSFEEKKGIVSRVELNQELRSQALGSFIQNQFDVDPNDPIYLKSRKATTVGLEVASLFAGAYGAVKGMGYIGKFARATSKVVGAERIAAQSVHLNRFHSAARGLSETGQNNIRVLRKWAKSKGWKKLSKQDGAPEKWGICSQGRVEWRLVIKPEGSYRQGLHANSNVPRFDARLYQDSLGQSYINPFTNEIGNWKVGTHIPLE